MARWSEVEQEVPELAARARALFDAKKHKTLATLRKDGSPRISGIELEFRDGDVWFGSMWQGVKALDLQRDPRFALHSGSDDPDDWKGDAKIAGRAEEITDKEPSRIPHWRTAGAEPLVPAGRDRAVPREARAAIRPTTS